MAILATSCLLSLFPEDAKGSGWGKVDSVSRRRNTQHGSLNVLNANGSGKLLTGRHPLTHSRLSLRERRKKALDHVPPSRSAANTVFNLTLSATFLINLTFWEVSGRLV